MNSIETSPIETGSRSAPKSDATQATISVRNLKRTYQIGGSDVLAVRGVNLDVSEGSFVGIVGVSGSGKSTLLHMIGGLDSPNAGEVMVANQSLRQLSAYEMACYRRKTIGFVFQSFYLVPNISAIENVRLALTLQGVYGSERERLADEAIERVGMSHRKEHKPTQLSGGEQQRITVARAIVNRPRLLLADEPTGNLDRKTAIALIELLNDIRQQDNMTILMVTHDEPLAALYCDEVIRMQDGRFVEKLEDVEPLAKGGK